MAVTGLVPGETSLKLTADNGVAKSVPVIVRENLLKDWPTATFTAASDSTGILPSYTIAGNVMTITGKTGAADQRVTARVNLPAGFGSKVTVGLDYTGPELTADSTLTPNLMTVISVGDQYKPVATLPLPEKVTPGHYRLDAVLLTGATQVEMRIGVFTTTPFTVTRLAIMKTSEYIE
ncbi:hypothetical protein [Bifidobacterium platyrrhinorum]|uniref:Uncharacterized protein n=1 Tax=Bifidobacterium platyrrhinorum TaxID=2661628 RepID=A0A6L9STP4_9BIFI|nr:hypothetical protein [Bifidobacterium platyrrhinorum]NEG55479.1 hypothetical protein [Bifidobacterium platyrrhinorum]